MSKKKTTTNNKKTGADSGNKKGYNKTKRGIIKTLWGIFGLMVAAVIVFFGLLSVGAIGYLPNIDELENPIDRYASQVILSDNELLFTYSLIYDNRIIIDYSFLSPHIIYALVSTEVILY